MRQRSFISQIAVTLAVSLIVIGCGEKRPDDAGTSKGKGAVEQAFYQASSEYGIPFRYLVGVAMLESNITPDMSQVPYLTENAEESKAYLGFRVAETAFGLPRESLGLSSSVEGDSLVVQINAYAQMVAETLSDYQLGRTPASGEDHYVWLSELAKIHRAGGPQSRSNQVVWAMSLMNLMNEGRIWQDPETGDTLELEPERRTLSILDFPPEGQLYFQLHLSRAELINARQFDLISHPSNLENKPTHIEVVHCPMNLSACIEIQNLNDAQELARLRAHYIIPTDASVVQHPLEVTPIDWAVEMTGANGAIRTVNDAVVVMLVGDSGRYNQQGHRINADPTWFTPWQLSRLGDVIKNLCQVLSQKDPAMNFQKCFEVGGTNGIQFHRQGASESYRWGDIPDFDQSIFTTYIRSAASAPAGEAFFVWPRGNKRFRAKRPFDFSLRFPISGKRILIERAVRCSDERLVWATMLSVPIDAQIERRFNMEIHDGGPNGDGHYFLRTMIYDGADEVVAWAIDDVHVYDFDPLTPAGDSKACMRSSSRLRLQGQSK